MLNWEQIQNDVVSGAILGALGVCAGWCYAYIKKSIEFRFSKIKKILRVSVMETKKNLQCYILCNILKKTHHSYYNAISKKTGDITNMVIKKGHSVFKLNTSALRSSDIFKKPQELYSLYN